jgi:lia operon protein LiaG
MNRKVATVAIVIWSCVAVAFTGLLIFFIAGGHGYNGLFNWKWSGSFNSGPVTVLASKTVPVSDISTINLKASSANVNFTHSQGSDIDVQVQGNSNSNTKNMYSITSDGGELTVTQNFNPLSGFPFNFGSLNQTINITLPDSYSKDLTCDLTSGDINFDGDYTFDRADIKQVSGDVGGGTIKANSLTLNSTSGDLRLSGINAGSYDISNVSGDISVSSLSGAGSVGTTSGDLRFGIASLTGACSVSATSGDINIGIAKGVSADVGANTQWGDVNTNFPVEYSGRNRNNATGKVGNGPYNSLNVSVTSGNITINQN